MLRLSPLARTAALAATLLAGPLLAPPAFAHAILLASKPPVGGSLPAGPVDMEFRFNSRIDGARSTLRLTGPEKRETSLALLPDSPPDVLRTSAELAPGKYVVRWQVLAVDGHVTRGEVPFTVVAKP
jgi:copper resistance protein C